jgi:hypothetical protein
MMRIGISRPTIRSLRYSLDVAGFRFPVIPQGMDFLAVSWLNFHLTVECVMYVPYCELNNLHQESKFKSKRILALSAVVSALLNLFLHFQVSIK